MSATIPETQATILTEEEIFTNNVQDGLLDNSQLERTREEDDFWHKSSSLSLFYPLHSTNYLLERCHFPGSETALTVNLRGGEVVDEDLTGIAEAADKLPPRGEKIWRFLLEILAFSASIANSPFASQLTKRAKLLKRVLLALWRQRERKRQHLSRAPPPPSFTPQLRSSSSSSGSPSSTHKLPAFAASALETALQIIDGALSSGTLRPEGPGVPLTTLREFVEVVSDVPPMAFAPHSSLVSARQLQSIEQFEHLLSQSLSAASAADNGAADVAMETSSQSAHNNSSSSATNDNEFSPASNDDNEHRRLLLVALCAVAVLRGSLCGVLSFLRNFFEFSSARGDVDPSVTALTGLSGPLRLLEGYRRHWEIVSPLEDAALGAVKFHWPAYERGRTASPSAAIAADGRFYYVMHKDGLVKLGTGSFGTVRGLVYDYRRANAFHSVKCGERGWLVVLGSRLYWRSTRSNAVDRVVAIDTTTLTELGEVPLLDGLMAVNASPLSTPSTPPPTASATGLFGSTGGSSEWGDAAAAPSTSTSTTATSAVPMFTDGVSLYLVAEVATEGSAEYKCYCYDVVPNASTEVSTAATGGAGEVLRCTRIMPLTAPLPGGHAGVVCDGCQRTGFHGKRYKCHVCREYSLCEGCRQAAVVSKQHTRDHPMDVVEEPSTSSTSSSSTAAALSSQALLNGHFVHEGSALAVILPSGTPPNTLRRSRTMCRVFDGRIGKHLYDVAVDNWPAASGTTATCFDRANHVIATFQADACAVATWRNWGRGPLPLTTTELDPVVMVTKYPLPSTGSQTLGFHKAAIHTVANIDMLSRRMAPCRRALVAPTVPLAVDTSTAAVRDLAWLVDTFTTPLSWQPPMASQGEATPPTQPVRSGRRKRRKGRRQMATGPSTTTNSGALSWQLPPDSAAYMAAAFLRILRTCLYHHSRLGYYGQSLTVDVLPDEIRSVLVRVATDASLEETYGNAAFAAEVRREARQTITMGYNSLFPTLMHKHQLFARLLGITATDGDTQLCRMLLDELLAALAADYAESLPELFGFGESVASADSQAVFNAVLDYAMATSPRANGDIPPVLRCLAALQLQLLSVPAFAPQLTARDIAPLVVYTQVLVDRSLAVIRRTMAAPATNAVDRDGDVDMVSSPTVVSAGPQMLIEPLERSLVGCVLYPWIVAIYQAFSGSVTVALAAALLPHLMPLLDELDSINRGIPAFMSPPVLSTPSTPSTASVDPHKRSPQTAGPTQATTAVSPPVDMPMQWFFDLERSVASVCGSFAEALTIGGPISEREAAHFALFEQPLSTAGGFDDGDTTSAREPLRPMFTAEHVGQLCPAVIGEIEKLLHSHMVRYPIPPMARPTLVAVVTAVVAMVIKHAVVPSAGALDDRWWAAAGRHSDIWRVLSEIATTLLRWASEETNRIKSADDNTMSTEQIVATVAAQIRIGVDFLALLAPAAPAVMTSANQMDSEPQIDEKIAAMVPAFIKQQYPQDLLAFLIAVRRRRAENRAMGLQAFRRLIEVTVVPAARQEIARFLGAALRCNYVYGNAIEFGGKKGGNNHYMSHLEGIGRRQRELVRSSFAALFEQLLALLKHPQKDSHDFAVAVLVLNGLSLEYQLVDSECLGRTSALLVLAKIASATRGGGSLTSSGGVTASSAGSGVAGVSSREERKFLRISRNLFCMMATRCLEWDCATMAAAAPHLRPFQENILQLIFSELPRGLPPEQRPLQSSASRLDLRDSQERNDTRAFHSTASEDEWRFELMSIVHRLRLTSTAVREFLARPRTVSTLVGLASRSPVPRIQRLAVRMLRFAVTCVSPGDMAITGVPNVVAFFIDFLGKCLSAAPSTVSTSTTGSTAMEDIGAGSAAARNGVMHSNGTAKGDTVTGSSYSLLISKPKGYAKNDIARMIPNSDLLVVSTRDIAAEADEIGAAAVVVGGPFAELAKYGKALAAKGLAVTLTPLEDGDRVNHDDTSGQAVSTISTPPHTESFRSVSVELALASEVVALLRQLVRNSQWNEHVRAQLAQALQQLSPLADWVAGTPFSRNDFDMAVQRALAACSVLGGFTEIHRIGGRVQIAASRHCGTLVAFQGSEKARILLDAEAVVGPRSPQVSLAVLFRVFRLADLTPVPEIAIEPNDFALDNAPDVITAIDKFLTASLTVNNDSAAVFPEMEMAVCQVRTRLLKSLSTLLLATPSTGGLMATLLRTASMMTSSPAKAVDTVLLEQEAVRFRENPASPLALSLFPAAPNAVSTTAEELCLDDTDAHHVVFLGLDRRRVAFIGPESHEALLHATRPFDPTVATDPNAPDVYYFEVTIEQIVPLQPNAGLPEPGRTAAPVSSGDGSGTATNDESDGVNVAIGLMPTEFMPGWGDCCYEYRGVRGRKVSARRQAAAGAGAAAPVPAPTLGLGRGRGRGAAAAAAAAVAAGTLFDCPYCQMPRLDVMNLCHHIQRRHHGSTLPVVCPICAASAFGDPNFVSSNFFGHLEQAHREQLYIAPPSPPETAYGPPLRVGDTVGCGWNRKKHGIFFTRNGQFLGTAFLLRGAEGTAAASANSAGPLPAHRRFAAALRLAQPGVVVSVNFGTAPFLFDTQRDYTAEDAAFVERLRAEEDARQRRAAAEAAARLQARREAAETLAAIVGFPVDFCVVALERNGDALEAAASWALDHFDEWALEQAAAMDTAMAAAAAMETAEPAGAVSTTTQQTSENETAEREKNAVVAHHVATYAGEAYAYGPDDADAAAPAATPLSPADDRVTLKPVKIHELAIGARLIVSEKALEIPDMCGWVDARYRAVGRAGTVLAIDRTRLVARLRFYDNERAVKDEWWFPVRALAVSSDFSVNAAAVPYDPANPPPFEVVRHTTVAMETALARVMAQRAAVSLARALPTVPTNQMIELLSAFAGEHMRSPLPVETLARNGYLASPVAVDFSWKIRQLAAGGHGPALFAEAVGLLRSAATYMATHRIVDETPHPYPAEDFVKPLSVPMATGLIVTFARDCCLSDGDRLTVTFDRAGTRVVTDRLLGGAAGDGGGGAGGQIREFQPLVVANVDTLWLHFKSRTPDNMLWGYWMAVTPTTPRLNTALWLVWLLLGHGDALEGAPEPADAPPEVYATALDELVGFLRASMAPEVLKAVVLRFMTTLVYAAEQRVRTRLPLSLATSTLAYLQAEATALLGESVVTHSTYLQNLLEALAAIRRVVSTEAFAAPGVAMPPLFDRFCVLAGVLDALVHGGPLPAAFVKDVDTEAAGTPEPPREATWHAEHDYQLVDLVNQLAENAGNHPLTLTAAALPVGVDKSLAAAGLDPEQYRLLTSAPPEAVLRRFAVLKQLNSYVSSVLPLVDLTPTYTQSTSSSPMAARASVAARLSASRRLIFYQVKVDFIDLVIARTAAPAGNAALSPPTIQINRISAELPVFLQAFVQLHAVSPARLRQRERAFRAVLQNERVEGEVGPYRETLSQLCMDLQQPTPPATLGPASQSQPAQKKPAVTLFIPCPNQQLAREGIGIGEHRDKYVPRPSASTPKELEMFEFVGRLLGIAIRTKNILALDWPAFVWKPLVGLPLTRADWKEIDYCAVDTLDKLVAMDEQTFRETTADELQWTTELSDGTRVDLSENTPGVVTWAQREEYARRVEAARLSESTVQVAAIERGLGQVVPAAALLPLLHWDELRLRVCGRSEINLSLLKRHTRYRGGVSPADPHIKYFWRALKSFTPAQRSAFLQFAWGRERLPAESELAHEEMKIFPFPCENPDTRLPHAETCFFNVKLPRYSSYEIMRERLLYAITHTRTIDGDMDQEMNDGDGIRRPGRMRGASPFSFGR